MLVRVFAGLIFLSTLVLLLSMWTDSSTSSVSAAPELPYVLYGRAWTSDGTVLGANLTIQARINNIHFGQSVNPSTQLGTSNTQTHAAATTAHYNYGNSSNFQICADDPATSPIEGGKSGENIVFYVSGIQATAQRVGVDGSARASIPFSSGGTHRVDLVIPSLQSATAVAATASSAACTTAAAPAAPTATPTPTPDAGFGGFTPPTATPTPAPAAAAAAVAAPTPVTAE